MKVLIVATAALVLLTMPHRGSAGCVCDCDGDGVVRIAELIRVLNIDLGLQPLSN